MHQRNGSENLSRVICALRRRGSITAAGGDRLDRAKAHDRHWALPERDSQASGEKVLDWFQCLRIIENADIVMTHLKEFIEMRDKSAS